ncbi:MAG: hypothetical protein RLZZ600_1183 [Actinomycetota bacterium]
MFSMLSTKNPDSVSLADIVPSCFVSLGWREETPVFEVPSCRATILILVDGLGVENIRNASGYSRFLAQSLNDSITASTVFPSTTAAALSSLVTGVQPAEHGILGYRVMNPETGELVNQLNGLNENLVDAGWMGVPSLINGASVEGKSVCVIGHPRFAQSALTRMLYGQALYVASRSIEERLREAQLRVQRGDEGLIFVYISDLDEAAHAHGAGSDAWLNKVEELDGLLKSHVAAVPRDINVVVTADHGIIDIPVSQHLNYPEELLTDVEQVGGEPRCLQLFLSDTASVSDVMERWRNHFGDEVNVSTRDEVFARSYNQNLSSRGARAGDIFVEAGMAGALYAASDPTAPGRNMVGQHGGTTPAEMEIPLIVWRGGEKLVLG